MKLRVKGFFAIAIFCLAALFPFVADGATISVDSVQAMSGQSFGVGVSLNSNTNTISGLTVPLEFNNSFLRVDSVSFTNSILPAGFTGVSNIDNTANTVRVSYIPNQYSNPLPTMSNSGGLIGTIHFTLEPGAAVGYIPIIAVDHDSLVSFGGHDIHYWSRNEFSNQSGISAYLPGFIPGAVKVLLSTDIQDDNNNGLLPVDFELVQNYPNPFNPTTTIEYALPIGGLVSLKVYNVIGQEVATLVDGFKSAGVYSIEYDAGHSPSGVYFYKLAHPKGTETRKMLLVK